MMKKDKGKFKIMAPIDRSVSYKNPTEGITNGDPNLEVLRTPSV